MSHLPLNEIVNILSDLSLPNNEIRSTAELRYENLRKQGGDLLVVSLLLVFYLMCQILDGCLSHRNHITTGSKA